MRYLQKIRRTQGMWRAASRVAWLIAALLTIHADVTASAAEPARPPNIVIILADDLGYGDVGCYNSESKIPTPHLDQLAREGIRCTDAHTPSGVCSPTRYGVLTGRYAWRTNLKQGVLIPWGAPLIDAQRLTLPKMLREHGYATACIGKWHLGWTWPTRDGRPPASGANRLSNVDFTQPIADGPITRGFDYYFGTDLPNYPPYCYLERDRTVGIPSVPNTPVFNRPGPMVPWWDWVNILPDITRCAVRYIDDRAPDQRPFFLYLALTAPHFPVVPAPEFKGKSQAGDYGDFVFQVDATVGKVLAALARSGAAENTLVIFTSDNGPEITGEVKPGVYDRITQFQHHSNGTFLGCKRDNWEGGHRVPFIARWPGQIPRGVTSHELICLTDLMATCAAVVGQTLPENAGEDSYNMLPALRDQPGRPPTREAVVHHSGSGRFSIRRGKWKLLLHPGSGGNDGYYRRQSDYAAYFQQNTQLYDVESDPGESTNLAGAHPEVVSELSHLLKQYVLNGRSTPGPAQTNDTPNDWKQLEWMRGL